MSKVPENLDICKLYYIHEHAIKNLTNIIKIKIIPNNKELINYEFDYARISSLRAAFDRERGIRICSELGFITLNNEKIYIQLYSEADHKKQFEKKIKWRVYHNLRGKEVIQLDEKECNYLYRIIIKNKSGCNTLYCNIELNIASDIPELVCTEVDYNDYIE